MRSGSPRSEGSVSLAQEVAGRPANVGVVIIHGNGEAEPGWINTSVIDRLSERLTTTGNAEITLDPSSRVTEIAETGRESTFKAYVRDGEIDGTRVVFAELNWSDLSRVGHEPLSQMVTALRLFHEAPSILTRLFLPPSRYVFHNLLSALLQFAVWLVRWLIAGFNGALFTAVFIVLVIRFLWKPIGDVVRPHWPGFPSALAQDALNIVIISVLTILAIACCWASSRVRSEDYGISQFLTATATFAALGIASVVAVSYLMPMWLPAASAMRPTSLEGYIKEAIQFNFAVAAFWDLVAVVAAAMWVLLAAKRVVLGRPADAPPFHRLSAALSLAVIQAIVWKVAVPTFGVITLAMAFGETFQVAITRMSAVGILNSAFMLIAIIACILLLSFGGLAQNVLRLKPERLAPYVPRVAVSSLLVGILVLASCANLFLDYLNLHVPPTGYIRSEPFLGDVIRGICGGKAISPCIAESPWLQLGVAIMGITIGTLLLLGVVQNIFKGVLHFARDIVDHQFRQPREMVVSTDREARFPRRQRIRYRLHAVMTEALGHEPFDRLVFVTHSQGSVIAYDCLRSDKVVAPHIETAAEIHLLTLGSPISHLYQYYFDEYASGRSGASDANLHARLSSWINMWRIDDPIGRANFTSNHNGLKVENIPLKAGGHNDYWREDEVCDEIVRLITQPLKPPR